LAPSRTIEEVVRFRAVVVDLKIRPPVRVLVETGDFQGAAERAAICVLRKLRFGDRNIRPELVRRLSSGEPPNE
jgi:hypothetical protein